MRIAAAESAHQLVPTSSPGARGASANPASPDPSADELAHRGEGRSPGPSRPRSARADPARRDDGNGRRRGGPVPRGRRRGAAPRSRPPRSPGRSPPPSSTLTATAEAPRAGAGSGRTATAAQALGAALDDEAPGERLHQRGVEPLARPADHLRVGGHRVADRAQRRAPGPAAGRRPGQPPGRPGARTPGRPQPAGRRRSRTPQPSIAVRSRSGVVSKARATTARTATWAGWPTCQ